MFGIMPSIKHWIDAKGNAIVYKRPKDDNEYIYCALASFVKVSWICKDVYNEEYVEMKASIERYLKNPMTNMNFDVIRSPIFANREFIVKTKIGEGIDTIHPYVSGKEQISSALSLLVRVYNDVDNSKKKAINAVLAKVVDSFDNMGTELEDLWNITDILNAEFVKSTKR
jgi:hypothetical protein